MTLGEIIKQARITKGLSQKELAALLGTPLKILLNMRIIGEGLKLIP